MKAGPVPGAAGMTPGIPTPANAELTWDAENRLVKAVVGGTSGTTVTYAYDHLSRLISSARQPVTGQPVTQNFLYDGWNRIAEYTGTTLKNTYLWGMDLSGTMQGAGGVGGLLAVSDHDPATRAVTATHYPAYDGNGNVSEYVNAAGNQEAHFAYDPFGNLTADSSGNAAAFPYRFSTKLQDAVTGLYYYGYRWYDPLTGRWPSRDPIEEVGGVNLYGFVENRAQNALDSHGLSWTLGTLGAKKSKRVNTYGVWRLTLNDFFIQEYLLNLTALMSIRSTFAQSLTRHYLGDSGEDYDASSEMLRMLSEEESWKALVKTTLMTGAKYADKNATSEIDEIYNNSEGGWLLQGSTSDYVHWALNDFYLGNQGKMWCDDENGKVMIHYHYETQIDDWYDFKDSGNLWSDFAGVTDAKWHRMMRVGLASEFRVTGKRLDHKIWEKGDIPSDIDP